MHSMLHACLFCIFNSLIWFSSLPDTGQLLASYRHYNTIEGRLLICILFIHVVKHWDYLRADYVLVVYLWPIYWFGL